MQSIKLISILAGPALTANPGDILRIPDHVSAEAAEALVAGRYAVPVAAKSAGTVALSPEAAVTAAEILRRQAAEQAVTEAAAKSADSVATALSLLDPANDDDWTAGGKPTMERVKELTGSATLTRAELDEMFPDFRRPDQKEDQAGDDQGNGAGSGDDAQANGSGDGATPPATPAATPPADPAPAAGRARSNKP